MASDLGFLQPSGIEFGIVRNAGAESNRCRVSCERVFVPLRRSLIEEGGLRWVRLLLATGLRDTRRAYSMGAM